MFEGCSVDSVKDALEKMSGNLEQRSLSADGDMGVCVSVALCALTGCGEKRGRLANVGKETESKSVVLMTDRLPVRSTDRPDPTS